MEELVKKLNQMPPAFTSNEFCKKAKHNGLSRNRIADGTCGLFLHQNAVQDGSKRRWRKKKVENFLDTLVEVAEINRSHDKKRDIARAVALLKSEGYKIMKPIQPQYEEI